PERERHVPAHREPAQRRPLDAEVLEPQGEVVREALHRERPLGRTRLAPAEAAQVRRQEPPASRQPFELVVPQRAVEREAVHEHHRPRTVPGLPPVHADAADHRLHFSLPPADHRRCAAPANRDSPGRNGAPALLHPGNCIGRADRRPCNPRRPAQPPRSRIPVPPPTGPWVPPPPSPSPRPWPSVQIPSADRMIGSIRSGVQRGSNVSSISALSTPSTASTSVLACSTICGAAGHSGVVRDIVTCTCPSVMSTPYTRPSTTTSRSSSGSLTLRSAFLTSFSVTITPPRCASHSVPPRLPRSTSLYPRPAAAVALR